MGLVEDSVLTDEVENDVLTGVAHTNFVNDGEQQPISSNPNLVMSEI